MGTKQAQDMSSKVSEWKAAIAKLDEAIAKASGTMTQRKAEARSALAEQWVPVVIDGGDLVTVTDGGEFGVRFGALLELAEELKQHEDDTLTAYMRANKTEDSTTALREQRKVLVEKIEAAITLGLATEADRPAKVAKSSSSSGGSTGTRKVSSKVITYSRRKAEGEWEASESQDSLSSLAFYFTKGLKADGTLVTNAAGQPDPSVKMGVRDLEAYVRKTADVNPYSEAFEVSLPNGYTLRAEVLTPDAEAAAEVTADEATDDAEEVTPEA